MKDRRKINEGKTKVLKYSYRISNVTLTYILRSLLIIVKTTLRYTHVRQKSISKIESPLDKLDW
jgi:hypothetical protein